MISIAIDGPSGAGKSTLAKKVAEALGYLYVDTGACYRGLAYFAIKNKLDLNDHEGLVNMLEGLDLKIAYNPKGQQRIIINKEDITDYIRTPEVTEGSSFVSAVPEVRQWLLETQREIAKNNNIIMDGRDIGTVVLPKAQVKIFLTATPQERAKRRHEEYLAKDSKLSYNEVLRDIIKRDERDSNRTIAPLKQSEDAVLIDSTDLDFDETLETILKIIRDGKF